MLSHYYQQQQNNKVVLLMIQEMYCLINLALKILIVFLLSDQGEKILENKKLAYHKL